MRKALSRAAVLLMVVVCTLAAAQARPPDPDTASRGEVVLAAKQALEGASRNLGRWLTTIIIVVLFAAALAVWRIWTLGRQVARLEDLRAAWDTRFAGTADEVLRLKRKLADAESRADKLEADIAALRPSEPDAATAQVAMVQSELVAVRERLDRAEGSLEAVADHTVVTTQERAMVEAVVRTAAEERARVENLVKTAAGERAKVEDLVKAATGERVRVEGLVKTAVQARAAAEAATVRAEGIEKRAATADALRVADAKLAQQQYPAAVQDYTLCLHSLAVDGADDPVLRFHALHNRALANLRQRQFDAVLADAAGLEKVASERAQGAARLLAGVARLWQGKVEQALQDFAAAVECDAGARAVIRQDEDVAAWVKANPRKAGPVKRFIKAQGEKPIRPRPSAAKKPARRR